MKLINIDIDLIEVLDLHENKLKTFHISPHAGASQAIEWWVSTDGKHHAIYWQDAYYDELLRERRNSGNMICPQDKTRRLIYIGTISGQVDLNQGTYIELFRCRLPLSNVAENEK